MSWLPTPPDTVFNFLFLLATFGLFCAAAGAGWLVYSFVAIIAGIAP